MEKILKSFEQCFPKAIVLASASPRRRELLQSVGLQFEVCPANINEKKAYAITPFGLVRALSKSKAIAASKMHDFGDKTIIAADTIVFRYRVFGKPKDIVESLHMLMKLSGKWHSVYTGVTLMSSNKTVTFVVRSRVKVKELQRQEIEKYIYVCNPLDKAGSYGIQDKQIVEKFSGSYTNIVGLPMEKLQKVLQMW